VPYKYETPDGDAKRDGYGKRDLRTWQKRPVTTYDDASPVASPMSGRKTLKSVSRVKRDLM